MTIQLDGNRIKSIAAWVTAISATFSNAYASRKMQQPTLVSWVVAVMPYGLVRRDEADAIVLYNVSFFAKYVNPMRQIHTKRRGLPREFSQRHTSAVIHFLFS